MFWNCFDLLNFFGATTFKIDNLQFNNSKFQRIKINAVAIPDIYKEYLQLNGWFFDTHNNIWYSDVEEPKVIKTIRPSFSEVSIDDINWDN